MDENRRDDAQSSNSCAVKRIFTQESRWRPGYYHRHTEEYLFLSESVVERKPFNLTNPLFADLVKKVELLDGKKRFDRVTNPQWHVDWGNSGVGEGARAQIK